MAAVGSFTQDAAGNITGAQTRSLAGAIAQETIAGTVTVNPDCTATATVNVLQGGTPVRTSTLDAVYDNFGRNLNTMASDTGTVMHVAHTRILHTAQYPSAITLPVVPSGTTQRWNP